MCLHARKAATRVPVQEEQNPLPENVTMMERVHGGQKRFPKVKIAEGDTGSQGRKNQSQALKKMTYPNHGCAKKQIPSHPVSTTSISHKRPRMPSNVKTYDGSEYSEDHLKIFQAAAKVECWAMPTWCHMFNSTLTGSASLWFDDLSPESVDSYDDLKRHSWKTSSNKRSALKTL
ncbi:hypothetical protein Tco_0002486 [Tanacetum coccineum]